MSSLIEPTRYIFKLNKFYWYAVLSIQLIIFLLMQVESLTRSALNLQCHTFQYNTRQQINCWSSALSAGAIDIDSEKIQSNMNPNAYSLNPPNIKSFHRNNTFTALTHSIEEGRSELSPSSSSYLIASLNTLSNAPINTVKSNALINTVTPDANNVDPAEVAIDFRDRMTLLYESSIKSISAISYNYVTNFASLLSKPAGDKYNVVASATTGELKKNVPVMTALQRMSRDIEFLDNVASRTPQLTKLEFAVLSTAVMASAISPSFLGNHVVEVLVPSMAALSASVGISAEYVGKVAVSNGKEVTALAIQAAAEAEAVLAGAERIKALLPLCVGISTTASIFALLAPNLIQDFNDRFNIQLVTELYFFCPLFAVLAAAVAGIASQEAISLATKASGIGNRRFASSQSVGRTWLSAGEQIDLNSKKITAKWRSFAIGVAPAPIIAVVCPGPLSFKAILCAAIAAAQAAYYLSIAEYAIAAAVDAVALKARSAALADVYSNQGSRAGSILPYTSALAGLCAAASAAAVEVLPLLDSVPVVQSLMSLLFPLGASLFSAAASVSKARCEADAAAATQASGSLGDDGQLPGYEKDPNRAVASLIKSSISTTIEVVRVRFKQLRNTSKTGTLLKKVTKWSQRNLASFYYQLSMAVRKLFRRSKGGSAGGSGNDNNKSREAIV